MTKRGLAKTTVNDGWKQPKKRKPMTEAQRKIASANLAKARAAKAPAKNDSIHFSVLAKDSLITFPKSLISIIGHGMDLDRALVPITKLDEFIASFKFS